MEKNLNKPYKGLHTDNHPSEQPKESYRFALNAVNESVVGDQTHLSNEPSNYACTVIPQGFYVIGDRYIEDNESVLFLVNPTTNQQQIGILRKSNIYQTVVSSLALGFKITNQIDCTYRLRRGGEKVIYWVDGYNNPRTFNLSKPQDFYTQAYRNYLEVGGNPNTYAFEKWDVNSFNLVKTYNKIPYFSDVQVLDYGNIKPGSYNFAIQYVDEDLNPTEWINVSNTVNIYNDNTGNVYESIRGSYDLHEYQKFPVANKSIKLWLANLDTTYPYYRIAIIQANAGTGKVNKVLVAEKQPINVGIFTYTGNDAALAEIDINEIRVDKEDIFKPQHIEQLENRLILANTEGLAYNWCEFQKYASKIDSDLATKNVILNSIESQANVKNAKSTFFYRGYMPGEVYSFGIMYIMKDNSLSPVFHIPGKSVANVGSTMGVYEANYIYSDIHNCINNDYWGVDVMGNALLGEKTRHHKFPLRQDSGIQLINNTNVAIAFTRYRLRLKITLKAGQVYPLDGLGNPIIIDYATLFQILGDPVTTQPGVLTINDIGSWIEVLDVTSSIPGHIVQLFPPDYLNVDPTSDIVVTYGAVFDFEYFYEAVPDNTIYSATSSDIYGIEFSNIEVPHPDVIGFYIVRNQVEDGDKIIVDNVIVGPTIKENEYRAFTHIMPGFPSTKFDDKSVWFFSPEVNYNQKLLQFNHIDPQAYYKTAYIHKPLNWTYATDEDGDAVAGGMAIPGVFVEDVQVGTSYDKSVHKKRQKDSDGFSLQVGYKNTTFNYVHTPLTLGRVSTSFVLNGSANKLINGTNYFNVSIDNRICMTEFSNTFNPAIFKTADVYDISYGPSVTVATTTGGTLVYAALRRGWFDDFNVFHDMDFAYQDYLTRPYYKEHMRPIYFGQNTVYNNFRVFNGDVQISGFNFITSVFNQLKIQRRKAKDSLWKYIVGAVLVVVGVVLTVLGVTSEVGVPILVGGIGLMAAAAGVWLINSGVKLDDMIAMIDEHYNKGLLQCIVDDSVFVQENVPVIGDDCIQWFADRATNIYIESRVPFGLRSGNTTEIPDFIDGPGPYSDAVYYRYLSEKLTVPDREQNGGRLYRGFATAEVYNCNPDYSRFQLEKSYIHLPVEYDCCFAGDVLERFPTRVWYSQQSFQEEKTDNYRNFLPNNYRDIEGENGEITDLHKVGNSLFIHTKEALWQLPQNIQERTNSELISFIGTGDFFNIPPKKIVDDNLGSGGTKHKWSKVKTKYGVPFISEIENKIYMQGEGLKDISINGNRDWFEGNLKSYLVQQLFDWTGYTYPYDNNPANPMGVGYLSCYDTRYERLLFTKRDFLVRNIEEGLNIESIIVGESPAPGSTFLYNVLGYSAYDGRFWLGGVYDFMGSEYTIYTSLIENFEDYPQYFENKSWTISYSFHTNTWVSYHSYLPNYYIHNQSNFYSFRAGSRNIWKHNTEGNYQTFYGTYYPHIIEYVSVSNPIQTRIFDDITFITEARKYDATLKQYADVEEVTHNKIILYNSKQSSGEQTMVVKDTEAIISDYLLHQTVNNPGEILIDRNERNWSINQLRDYVIDYAKPLFSQRWTDIQNDYFIDKVPNLSIIDFNKPWEQLQSFRDKFLVIRLKFDNFADVNLITQYSIETENKSER